MPLTARRLLILLYAIFSLGLLPSSLAAQRASQIDPFLGVDGGGNVFPGALVPFGILKAGPDMGNNNGNAGWLPGAPINGFSQTHMSGTGGGAKYGNILIQPTVGPVLPSDHASAAKAEHASAGSYGVTLARYGIDVEIASARRAAIYRITYPTSQQSNLLIDAGHCLSSYPNQNENQKVVASAVHVVSPSAVQGYTTVTGGWNFQPTTYTVYFYAESDTQATASGTWKEGSAHPDVSTEETSGGSTAGAWLSFPTHAAQTVQLKIGISFVSLEQARQNAASEIAGFDFSRTRTAAAALWDKALSPIQIEGASQEELQQFSTALYHAMFQPTDHTGENPLFVSQEPYYDDYYAIWDTFRTSAPLLTLIAEDRESAMVRSLVDIYRHEGWLPDGRSGGYTGRLQGGTDADMVIVDGFLKQLPGIDWQTAYQAVVTDAENIPRNPIMEGRGDLADWRTLGYLSIEGTDRPASKHMEYAANDYAIALFAKGLGKERDSAKYLERSRYWRNLWNAEAADHGFKGFIWPRYRDGRWKSSFDPLLSGTWGEDNFYEGNSWTYSLFVPQDVAGLIEQAGGTETFLRRLDAFFDVPHRYDVGNEPGFLAPYLYIWAGRPDKTAERVREILARSFRAGQKGLPGNDDSGAMSSWYAFGRMGFFPNAGQDVYLIGSPAYRKSTLHLAEGKTFTIEAEGLTDKAIYVVRAKLNGKPLDRAWLRHREIVSGGRLVLTMADKPAEWGRKNPPPSSSTEKE